MALRYAKPISKSATEGGYLVGLASKGLISIPLGSSARICRDSAFLGSRSHCISTPNGQMVLGTFRARNCPNDKPFRGLMEKNFGRQADTVSSQSPSREEREEHSAVQGGERKTESATGHKP